MRQPYEGLSVDLWAAGVTLFAMLCGYLPFQDSNFAKLKIKIASATFKMPDTLNLEAQDLLMSMLQKDPAARPSLEQIRQHKWLLSFKEQTQEEHVKLDTIKTNIKSDILDLIESQLNLDKQQCLSELSENLSTDLTTAYYLLEKKTQRADKNKQGVVDLDLGSLSLGARS